MWIITRSKNDYNQHGDYFVACFKNKPTFKDFVKIYLQSEGLSENCFEEGGYLEERAKRYYENKGRTNKNEDSWYFLSEIKEGELYKCQHSKY